MEEKVVFERAFHMHGKHFHRIKAFVSNVVVISTMYAGLPVVMSPYEKWPKILFVYTFVPENALSPDNVLI